METIRDNRNRIIGWINDTPDRIYAQGSNGFMLGYYLKKEKKTVDRHGLLVGRYDATMALILANSPYKK